MRHDQTPAHDRFLIAGQGWDEDVPCDGSTADPVALVKWMNRQLHAATGVMAPPIQGTADKPDPWTALTAKAATATWAKKAVAVDRRLPARQAIDTLRATAAPYDRKGLTRSPTVVIGGKCPQLEELNPIAQWTDRSDS